MKEISDELIRQMIIILNKPGGVTTLEKAGIIQQLQRLEVINKKTESDIAND